VNFWIELQDEIVREFRASLSDVVMIVMRRVVMMIVVVVMMVEHFFRVRCQSTFRRKRESVMKIERVEEQEARQKREREREREQTS
jgi:hypothetical protein